MSYLFDEDARKKKNRNTPRYKMRKCVYAATNVLGVEDKGRQKRDKRGRRGSDKRGQGEGERETERERERAMTL